MTKLFDSTLELQDSGAVTGQTLLEESHRSRPLICNQLRENPHNCKQLCVKLLFVICLLVCFELLNCKRLSDTQLVF